MTPPLGRNAWTRVASPPSDSPCNGLSMDARCSSCVPLMGNLSLGHFLVVHSFRPASNGLDSKLDNSCLDHATHLPLHLTCNHGSLAISICRVPSMTHTSPEQRARTKPYGLTTSRIGSPSFVASRSTPWATSSSGITSEMEPETSSRPFATKPISWSRCGLS